MKLPALIVNFKTYREGSGEKALELARACEKVKDSQNTNIIVAPQFSDIKPISDKFNLQVFSQHLDPISYGSHTGHALPENLKEAGISGTLLNHSERRISKEKIGKSLKRASKLDIETVVCVQNPEEAMEVAELGPDYIAYEPPELIGGDVSVSESKPEVVEKAVDHVKAEYEGIEVLTGAGVKTREDVKKAIELGTKGILIASGVVKADKPEEALKNLVKGF